MSKMSKSVIWILRKWVWKRVLNNRGFLAKSDRSVLDHRFFFFFFFFFFLGGGGSQPRPWLPQGCKNAVIGNKFKIPLLCRFEIFYRKVSLQGSHYIIMIGRFEKLNIQILIKKI